MGAFAEANGKDSVRLGAPCDPPNVTPESNSDNRACGGCDENSFAPGASFFDVALAFENGDFDSLRLSFGFAEGRADIAEELHALGADRFATDVTFFDGKLAHVPEAGFGGVWIGGLRRFELSSNRSFLVNPQTGRRRGLWNCVCYGYGGATGNNSCDWLRHRRGRCWYRSNCGLWRRRDGGWRRGNCGSLLNFGRLESRRYGDRRRRNCCDWLSRNDNSCWGWSRHRNGRWCATRTGQSATRTGQSARLSKGSNCGNPDCWLRRLPNGSDGRGP